MNVKVKEGIVVGEWTIVKKIGRNQHRQSIWLCRCSCGNEKGVVQSNLTSAKSTNCGCKRGKSLIKHNLIHHELYRRWSDMKTRCYNQKCIGYDNYGGRGIKVCDEWRSDFEAFYTWAMCNGYRDGLSIDRKNNDGNYEPGNCRWVTKCDQRNNRRNTIYVQYQGKSKPLAVLCIELKLDYHIVKDRLRQNWKLEKAISEPIKRKGVS